MRRVYNETHHPIDQAVLSTIAAIFDYNENPERSKHNARLNGNEYPAYQYTVRSLKNKTPGIYQLDADRTMTPSEREQAAHRIAEAYGTTGTTLAQAASVITFYTAAAAIQEAYPDMATDDITLAVRIGNRRSVHLDIARLAEHWISVFQFGPNGWEA